MHLYGSTNLSTSPRKGLRLVESSTSSCTEQAGN